MLGENDGNTDPRAFNSKSILQRVFVLSAGVAMNFLLAFLMFTSLVFVSVLSEPVVKKVVDGTAAMEVGLQPGDRIVKVDNTTINIYEDLIFVLSQSNGQAMDVAILRDGKKIEKSIAPRADENGDYKIGFELNAKTGLLMKTQDGYARAGIMESIANGFFRIIFYIKVTLYGLSQLVTLNLSMDEMSGPIGIVDMIGQSYTASASIGISVMVKTMMNFVALLSANLAVMNLLPLPALDGGRLIFIFVEFLRRKPVPAEKEGLVHAIGLALLMALAIAIAYNDVVKILIR